MNQNDIEKHLTEMLEQSERDIDKVFANRLKALLQLIADMHKNYNEDGAISRTQINKYNRFEKEMERIKQMIHADYQELYKEIDKLMKSQYVDNFLMSAFVYEMATATDMQYQVPSAELIKQAILNPIKELTLPSLMTQHRNEIVRKIRIELAQGIQAGESYSDMAKRLEDTVNFSRNKARTVAVTEAGRTQSIGRLKSIEQAEQYVNGERFWMATLDGSTRHSHRVLDGQEAGEDNLFEYQGHKAPAPSLFGVAKLDIRCRCDIGYKINGKFPEVRRARDYDNAEYQKRLAERMDELMANEGLTEKQAEIKAKKQIYPPNKVIEYQTFEDWVKDQPKGT